MKKNIFALLVLLMTAATGAWATEPKVYDSGEVEAYSLQKGDILLPGVTLTKGSYNIDVVAGAGRYFRDGQIRSVGDVLALYPITIGANGVINNKYYGADNTTDYTPITADGEVGNAWEVTYVDAPPYRPGYKEITISGIKYTPAATGYTVSLKEGTEDANKWTITPNPATAGTQVKATYSGTKKVKSVKAVKKAAEPAANIVDLSTLTGDYEAQNGDVLTGTLNGSEKPYKISIADGATVTLDNATINGVSGWASDPMMAEYGMYDGFYQCCGLTCVGDATIILKDGTENAVKGFYKNYPGIYVPENKTLTIKGGTAGTGKLTAQNGTGGIMSGTGAGIGAGYNLSCGHINIQGGEITATGQSDSAGIGGANNGNCGNITISGGKINATGAGNAAGIGGGAFMSCGDITIESTVISVTATRGSTNGGCSIGKGYNGSCGTVTIGGTVYPDGTSSGTFTYPQP